MKTVKEVSQLAGISIRTLRYYDEIGLLKPTQFTEAGYRLYDDRSLEQLQEIMFFKELDLPLETIQKIIHDPSLDRQEILRMQKLLLERKRNRLNGIIELIDDVIQGVNTMNFEAFTENDINRIVEHTVSQLAPEDLQNLIQRFGSLEAFRAELADNLKDKQLETHLIKLYGGKDKAVQASLSPTPPDDAARYTQDMDAAYRQFSVALQTNDHALKIDAVKQLAACNKALFHFENIRYYMLELADTIERNPPMVEATDKEYGAGVSQYMVDAIREYYGMDN